MEEAGSGVNEGSEVDGFVNAHDILILSPPRMKMLSFCGIGKRAVATRSNFL